MTDNAELVERLRAQIPYQGKSAQAFLCHEAADAIAALQQESPRSEVTVKPLEWLEGDYAWFVVTPFGRYEIFHKASYAPKDGMQLAFTAYVSDYVEIEMRSGIVLGYFAEIEAAKAVAQADYKQRILSALAHPLHQPAPEARPEYRAVVIRNAVGGFNELVIEDVPVVAARPYSATIQVLTRLGEPREIIGYRVFDAAPAPEPQAPVPDGVTTKATVDFFDRGTRYLIEPGQFTILMAHGILSRVAPGVYQLATEAELLADPGSAGVNNPKPAAVLAVIRAALTAAPAQAPAPDGVTDEMVEKAIAAYDRIYKVEFPARGSWVTNHRDAMRAALTAAERSR